MRLPVMATPSLLDDLDALIAAELAQKKPKIKRLVLGYKAYHKLMSYKKFSTEVTESAIDPNKRKYQGFKIKVSKDDFEMRLEKD